MAVLSIIISSKIFLLHASLLQGSSEEEGEEDYIDVMVKEVKR